MKLLPYDSFQIDTIDSIELVHQRLSTTILPQRWWKWRYPFEARYKGVLLDNTFQVQRIRNNQTINPNIQGRLQALPHGGTTIYIKVSLDSVMIGVFCTFCLVWATALGDM
jgi:hypothetical protein